MSRLPVLLELPLQPLAVLFRGVTTLRGMAFDRGWRSVQKAKVPVVSVGNLTAGGTGKTPLVSMLVDGLKMRGYAVGIISRGYGGRERGPALVPSDGLSETARRFGDETTWFANHHGDVPVVVAANRFAAAEFLTGLKAVDVIVADDAFQHRQLYRSYDAVVIDASEPNWHYRPLPVGRMREPFSAILRASAVFLTKTNLVDEGTVNEIRQRIQALQTPSENGPYPALFEYASRILGVMPLFGDWREFLREESPMSDVISPAMFRRQLRGRAVVLASGIGRPEAFNRLVEADLGVEVCEHVVFRDHHAYTDRDKSAIVMVAEKKQAGMILVTEKDAVKLGREWPNVSESGYLVGVSRLVTEPRTDLKGLYEAIARKII